tara:strand:- start:1085 stop:1240 length:156 start_codon:yes stop_codon:yes gene_type:complete
MKESKKPIFAIDDIKLIRRALIYYQKNENFLESEAEYEKRIIALYHRMGRV